MQTAAPPTLQHLFLESPLPMTIALAAVGLILLFLGVQRRQSRLKIAGLAGLALSVGVFVLAATVQTKREQVIEQTRLFVEATAPLDMQGLRSMVDDRATLTGPGGATWLTGGQFLSVLEQSVNRFSVEDQDIREIAGEIKKSGRAVTYLDVRTKFSSGGTAGLPTRSKWLLEWEPTPDGSWRVIGVQWLSIFNREPTEGMLR